MINAKAATPAYVSLAGASMGTTWSVQFKRQDGDVLGLEQRIQAALGEVVAQMSTWDPDSAISRLNRADPGWYQVAPAFFQVLSQALDLAQATDGAYDPTMGALVDLWGFGPAGAKDSPPAPAAISAALSRSGWQRTALSAEHRAVWQPGGMHFDLSSIAKGYGVDEIARVLNEAGMTHYLAELGGELKACGLNPAGKAWELDIEAPGQGDSNLPVSLNNSAIATSGDYRRYFIHQGRRYAHTLNPHSGLPLPETLASVTVIHPQCMMADALATALLALGPDQGMHHAQQQGIAALFMSRHKHDVAASWTDTFPELAGARNTFSCS